MSPDRRMKSYELFIKSQDFLTHTVDTHWQYRGLQITTIGRGEEEGLNHQAVTLHWNAFNTGFMISITISLLTFFALFFLCSEAAMGCILIKVYNQYEFSVEFSFRVGLFVFITYQCCNAILFSSILKNVSFRHHSNLFEYESRVCIFVGTFCLGKINY